MIDQILTPLLVAGGCLAASGIILLVYRKLSAKQSASTDTAPQPQNESIAPKEPKKKRRQITFVTPKETQDYLRNLLDSSPLDPEWQRCGGAVIDYSKLYTDQGQTNSESGDGSGEGQPSDQHAFGIKIEYVPILPGETAAPSITFLNSKIEFSTIPTWSIHEGEDYISLDPATGLITGVAEGEAKLQAILTDENGNTMRVFTTVQIISFREEEAEAHPAAEASTTETPTSAEPAPTPSAPEPPASEEAAPVHTIPALQASESATTEDSEPASKMPDLSESIEPSFPVSVPIIPAATPTQYPYKPSIPTNSTASNNPSLSEQINCLQKVSDDKPKCTTPLSAPEFAPRNTWVRRIEKSTITNITLVNSYIPDGTEKLSWDASNHRIGTLTAYLLADGKSLVIAGNGYGKIFSNANACQMFGNFKRLKSIHGLHLLDTSRTTNMNSMFYNDIALTELDLSSFNTSRVKDMGYMFYYCTGLTYLDLSSFKTSALQGVCFMFYNCTKLRTIFVSIDWDVSVVTNDSAMFAYCLVLEGESGTKYDSNFIHRSRAVIDDDDSHPGYLSRAT